MNSINNSNFSITVKNKLNYVAALIDIFIICVSVLKLKDIQAVLFHFNINSPYNFNSPLIILAVYLIGLYCIYNLVFILTGVTTITINHNILTVNIKILGINFVKNYQIDQIQNLRIEQKASDNYWGFQGAMINDYKLNVLVFKFNNNNVVIGKNLEAFDVEKLKNVIKPY